MITGTGLSAQLNVVEEPKLGPENATILLQNTVVQTVKEQALKLERATHKIAVIFSY